MLNPDVVANRVIYWPELLWDSTVQTVNAGASLQQPLINWGAFDQYNLLTNLVNVTTMSQAGMVLNVTADETISPPISTSLRGNQIAGPGSWVAHKTLVATLQNLSGTGGVAATNYLTQADYGLWIWPLNDGLRYAFNMPAAGDTRASIAQRLPQNLRQMIDDGLRPLVGSELIRREDMVWVYQEFAPQPWAVNAGQTTPVYSKRVPTGRVYALAGWTVDPSIGGTRTLAQQQTDALTMQISRDQQANYLTPLLAGLPATRVVDVWIPATQTLTIGLTSNTDLPAVPLSLTIADLPLSTFNAIRWNRLTDLQASGVSTSGLGKVRQMVLDSGW